jgi:2-polyprenyl-3-methyl-5-hydroxy-6-metoxy-1,4-benzoquinol methylase
MELNLRTETLTQCPICSAQAYETILTQSDGYIPLLQLNRCQVCQAIYLNPRLTLDSIIAVENESEVYAFTRELAEAQINHDLTQLVFWLEAHMQTGGRHLLDIGCNRGLLLEAARRQGWRVAGVEISPKAAELARHDYGLNIYSTLAEIPITEHFDLITAWHVLEHTLAPVSFLREAAARLAPGGILAIQAPSFDYVDEFRRRNQTGSILCTVHNFYFTRRNIIPTLSRAGLMPLHLYDDSNTLVLTVIAARLLTQSERLEKAWRLVYGRQWRVLVRELTRYLRWKLRLAV